MVKEDMDEVEVTEEDTEDRNNWRWKIRCGDPWWEKLKEEESSIHIKILLLFKCGIVAHQRLLIKNK